MTVGLDQMPRQPARQPLLLGLPQPWQTAFVAFVLAVLSVCSGAWDVDRTMAAASKMGPRAIAGARALQSLQAELQIADEADKLRGVNEFFNRRVLFRDDMEVWGQTDYWATPVEMLDKGAGDCVWCTSGRSWAGWGGRVRPIWCWPTMSPPLQSHLFWTTW